MNDYFVAIGGAQQGPFPLHELVARGMRPESLVWREGMGDWQRADSLAELAGLFAGPVTPPMPPHAAHYVGNPYAPPPYAQPVGYAGAPQYNQANSNRVAAGVCGILLGGLGIHKFILGFSGTGLIMLLVTICTCGFGWPVMHLIGLIEGIVYLSKSDAEFHQFYVVERRNWF